MAAVDAALSLLSAGDHVVASQNIYGGTFRAMEQVWKPRGVSITYVDPTDTGAFGRAIGDKTRMVWIETPANPLLQLVDVRAVAALTRPRGITLVDDNTFPSPYFQRPLTQGVDVVVHSTSKYISGHSDVIGGAVAVNDEKLYERIKFHQNAIGAIPGPMDCWLSLRGLKTLAVRMRQHEANAKAVAVFLSQHPKVVETIYPGLESHPQHELAKAQMDGFGGIVTFRVEGGNAQVAKLVKALKLFYFAESLGGVESLVCHPATMTHAVMTREEQEAVGITEGIVRLSVGIEDVEDLIEDLEQGLGKC
jgi:cystathionine beta-lyase/cystathionine gamma-synthase